MILISAAALAAASLAGAQECNTQNAMLYDEDGEQKAHCWTMDFTINTAELAARGWSLASMSPLQRIDIDYSGDEEPKYGKDRYMEISYWNKDGVTVQCRSLYGHLIGPNGKENAWPNQIGSYCMTPRSPETETG